MAGASDPREHPYSSVRSADGVTAYVSGVLPYADDGRTIELDRDRAVERVLSLLRERLEAAGFTMRDVVKTTVYLTDLGWRPALNAAYLAAFDEPRPARTAVEVSALPQGAPIEVEAVAQRTTPR